MELLYLTRCKCKQNGAWKKARQCNIPVKLKYQKCVYIKNGFQVIPIELYMSHNAGLHKITTAKKNYVL